MERFSIQTLDPDLLNFELWPSVDEEAIDPANRERFLNRSRAVRLFRNDVPRKQILLETGISGNSAVKMFKRCLALHPDGRIYGFRALIPNIRIEPYSRRSPISREISRCGHGGVGAFAQLLRRYPVLDELIQNHVFKLSKKRHIYESRVPLKSLHKRFLDECRKLNLDVGLQYPFNTKKLGYTALSAYIQRLVKRNPEKAIPALFGANATKKLRTSDGSGRPVTKPFERVECDAHLIDAVFCILIPSIFGELIPRIVNRLWLLVIKEITSRAILGYHLSMSEECNANDVLEAVKHALTKWEPRSLSIPTLEYAKGAGFPSSRNEKFIGACWREISVDGAMANISSRVVSKIKRITKAETIVLLRRNPDDRPFIERFFGVLEESGFHRLPNTTGSSPNDPRRKNPELASIRYTIQVEQLEDLTDVLIANFNNTPHGSIGYRTPLEYLEFLCERGSAWPTQADPFEVERTLAVTKTVTVHGGIDIGRRPYIIFQGVKYTSDVIRRAYHLVNTKISIEIRRDLRTVRTRSNNRLPSLPFTIHKYRYRTRR